jgi:hypothetical protein
MLEISRFYQAAGVLVGRFLEFIRDGGERLTGECDREKSPIKNLKLIFTFGQLLVVFKFLKFIGCRYQDDMAMDILALLGCVEK